MTDEISKIALACYGKTPGISRFYSVNNSVFLLKYDNEDKVLKIERDGDLQWKIKNEIAMIALAQQQGLPVPVIEHIGTDGNIIPNHWYIMKRAGSLNLHGCFLHKNDKNTRELYSEFGRILGRIHQVTLQRQGYLKADRINEFIFGEVINKRFERCIRKLSGQLANKEIHKLTNIIGSFKESKQTRLCHKDFGPWHAIIDKNKIVAIIDWEFAEGSDEIYDFVKSELFLYIYSGNLEEFREGYCEIQPLPPDFESVAMPYRVIETLNLMTFVKNNQNLFFKIKKVLDSIITSNGLVWR